MQMAKISGAGRTIIKMDYSISTVLTDPTTGGGHCKLCNARRYYSWAELKLSLGFVGKRCGTNHEPKISRWFPTSRNHQTRIYWCGCSPVKEMGQWWIIALLVLQRKGAECMKPMKIVALARDETSNHKRMTTPFDDFIELHGDRAYYADDKAFAGGLRLNGNLLRWLDKAYAFKKTKDKLVKSIQKDIVRVHV